MKNTLLLIIIISFLHQSSLFSQIPNDTLVLNLFKARFLSEELDRLINSKKIENFESLKDIFPSDSITYNIRIDKLDNSSINFNCDIYIGSYDIQHKSFKKISSSYPIREPLIINKKGEYYFITIKSDLIKFVQNEVDLTIDKNIMNLVKLLYELDFQNENDHLLNFEDTILDGEKDFINNYSQAKMIIERNEKKITVKFYSYGRNNIGNGEEVTYLNILEITNSDIQLKKEIINRY